MRMQRLLINPPTHFIPCYCQQDMTDARLFHQHSANILANMIMQLDSFEHCVPERIFKVYVCTMIHEIVHAFAIYVSQ